MAVYSVSTVSCAALSLALLGCPAVNSPKIVRGDHLLGEAGYGEVVCRTELIGFFRTPRWTVIVQDAAGVNPSEILVVQASWRGGPGLPQLIHGYVTDESQTYSLHLESLRLVSNRYPNQVFLR